MTSMRKSPLFMDPKSLRRVLPALLFFAVTNGLLAAEEESEEKKEKEKVTVEKLLENSETFDGLFPVHRNLETGKLLLEVSVSQLSDREKTREFIHFSHTLDGVTELGFFRGQFSRSRVFKIRRHFEKLEFVARNTSFYFN